MVFLSLGSNLGEREANILRAYHLIEEGVGKILAKSSFFYSDAWGFQSENRFVNTVIAIETALSPENLLTELQKMEREMGRKAKTANRYEDRIIDIDILFYNDLTINSEKLQIPHSHLAKRDFVLVPLAEICAEFPVKME